mmetsp:Transcript_8071/g.17140  ORF Transcript_8071/g.17140 Transcript_8071/m.17140 type:complete len:187 (-) Transcript_8071:34-594(-)
MRILLNFILSLDVCDWVAGLGPLQLTAVFMAEAIAQLGRVWWGPCEWHSRDDPRLQWRRAQCVDSPSLGRSWQSRRETGKHRSGFARCGPVDRVGEYPGYHSPPPIVVCRGFILPRQALHVNSRMGPPGICGQLPRRIALIVVRQWSWCIGIRWYGRVLGRGCALQVPCAKAQRRRSKRPSSLLHG